MSGAELPIRVHLTLAPSAIREFYSMFQRGVVIKVRPGYTVRELLCGYLAVDPTFLQNHIQTVFHDGKAVDDLDSEVLKDGSTLALSAAMPGLAGAIMRRQGILGALRSMVPAKDPTAPSASGEGRVTVKIFNLLLDDLVPLLLQQGVWFKREDWEEWSNDRSLEFLRGFLGATLEGQEIDPRSLMANERLKKAAWVFLTVTFTAHP